MKLLVFALLGLVAGACSRTPNTRSLEGRWQGSSYAFDDSAPVTVDFRRRRDSLDAFVTMTAEAMLRDKPLLDVRFDDGLLHMELANHAGARAVFDGRVAGDTIDGAFQKNGNAVRVRLVRTGPIPSVPYSRDTISFRSVDGVTLRGTLYLPPGTQPHPAVVLIHGSGPSERSDFNYLADVFARHGIAAIAYDKRGAGSSEGNTSQITLETFADDARAAVSALLDRPDIDHDAVGLCGVSEGGWVAPVAASKDKRISFVIAVVPPGNGFEANGFYQNSMRLRRERGRDRDVEAYLRAMTQVGTVVRARVTPRQDIHVDRIAHGAQALLDSLNQLRIFDVTDLPRLVPAGETLDHFRWKNLDFDPYPYWKKVSVPVLVVLGGRDRNLDSKASFRRIGRALRENSNGAATFLVYEEANHDLMVPGKGPGFRFPLPAPGYPDTLARWTVGTIGSLRQ